METTSKKTLNVLSIDYDYFMKFKDDEHFGGKQSADSDFSDIDSEEDDDL